MKKINSTDSWRPIDLPLAENLIGSTGYLALEKKYWPPWASETKWEQFWLHGYNDATAPTVPGSAVRPVAGLVTERHDSKDEKPYNHNVHLIAKSTDGEYYLSNPVETELNHHSSGALKLAELFKGPE